MGKDYSLLRPFDLEAAKRGERVQSPLTSTSGSYIAGPDVTGRVVWKNEGGRFQNTRIVNLVMLPLAWVEGKPVYRGDVLYTDKGQALEIDGFKCDGVLTSGMWCEYPQCLTWQKPKTKREGWVNIYTEDKPCWRYKTKEQADQAATTPSGKIDPERIACVRIEWEE